MFKEDEVINNANLIIEGVKWLVFLLAREYVILWYLGFV
jgi:hypothetical protein